MTYYERFSVKEDKHVIFISDLLTEYSKMFLTITLISGEVTAGDPLVEQTQTSEMHLGKIDRSY